MCIRDRCSFVLYEERVSSGVRWCRRRYRCRRNVSETGGVLAHERSIVGWTERPFLSLNVQRNFSGGDRRRLCCCGLRSEIQCRDCILETDPEAITNVCTQHDRARSFTWAELDVAQASLNRI